MYHQVCFLLKLTVITVNYSPIWFPYTNVEQFDYIFQLNINMPFFGFVRRFQRYLERFMKQMIENCFLRWQVRNIHVGVAQHTCGQTLMEKHICITHWQYTTVIQVEVNLPKIFSSSGRFRTDDCARKLLGST